MNTTDLTQTISSVLIKLRVNHPGRLTQKNIEDAAGLIKGSYHDMESGKCRFKVEDLFKIAGFYNMRPSQIIALMEAKPEEISRVKQLQLDIDMLIAENARLKIKLAEARRELV